MASGTINTVIQSLPQFGLRHALEKCPWGDVPMNALFSMEAKWNMLN
jgi:hypothetical protein